MGLTAGAAKACITPPLGTSLAGYFTDRKAVDIHDDLYAKALIVDDGSDAVALVVCDMICCPREVLDRAKEIAHARLGIPPTSITISCTHTHTGPATAGLLGAVKEEAYNEWLAPRIADALQMAFRRMQPAVACSGVGLEPNEVFNRRWVMKDGTVKMNPGIANPDLVRPSGPTDPEVGVLALETTDGTPIAAVINYALHYVGGGDGLVVSADYFALVEKELNRMADASFPVLLGNGCCGDINNINFQEAHPPRPKGGAWSQAEHVARVVAAGSLKTWEQAIRRDDVTVGGASCDVPVDRRSSTEEQLEQDRAVASQTFEESGLSIQDWQYARERLMVNELPLVLNSVVSAGHVGDAAWVGLPGEVFCQFGLTIKEQSPFGQTMPMELANDYLGYICTPEAIGEGGYETWLARSSMPTGEGGWALADASVGLLKELASE